MRNCVLVVAKSANFKFSTKTAHAREFDAVDELAHVGLPKQADAFLCRFRMDLAICGRCSCFCFGCKYLQGCLEFLNIKPSRICVGTSRFAVNMY